MLEIYHTYGWRKTEITGMRVRQADFTNRLIHLETSKNGKPRVAPMTDTVYALLKQYAEGKEPDDHLFTRANGTPVDDFRKTWRKFCKDAGVNILVHDLRRTAARNLRRVGVAEGTIMEIGGMEIGGWVTRSMFERYNIKDVRDMREALDKLKSHDLGHDDQPQPPEPDARPN